MITVHLSAHFTRDIGDRMDGGESFFICRKRVFSSSLGAINRRHQPPSSAARQPRTTLRHRWSSGGGEFIYWNTTICGSRLARPSTLLAHEAGARQGGGVEWRLHFNHNRWVQHTNLGQSLSTQLASGCFDGVHFYGPLQSRKV